MIEEGNSDEEIKVDTITPEEVSGREIIKEARTKSVFDPGNYFHLKKET